MFKIISLIAFIASTSADRIIKIPDGFQLGSATAAYQIEGGWDADGRGPSIWDTFTQNNPDLIADGSNGNVAANSYELYEKDIEALKSIGFEFYRFSISWSRILTNGDISSVNEKGIQYYHKLIDLLNDNGIEPMITMYHWDLPQPIQDLGGFTNPLIVQYFEQYANLLFKEYGPKIKYWITFNEPINYCTNGYATGKWPPALKLSGVGDYLCAHYTLLAHAKVYHLYKDKYFADQKGKVGIALFSNYAFPEDDMNTDDKAAAQRELEFTLGIYAHPIFSASGGYPQTVRDQVDVNSADQGFKNSRLPVFTDEERESVRGSADFLGLNYYTSVIVTTPPNDDDFVKPSTDHDKFIKSYQDPTWPKAKSPWLASNPDGLYNLLKWIRDQYIDVEVIITENGWSDDGEIDDTNRIHYLESHLEVIVQAVKEGCRVTGHTTWSLIDNFEWLMGYTEKFGIFRVDVDDDTLTRVEKDSARWLKQVIDNREFTIVEDLKV